MGHTVFVCKRSPGRTGRHHALNDLVARAFGSAGLPVTKEPHGLTRSDGKRLDGPMERRQTAHLGRDCCLSSGRFVRWCLRELLVRWQKWRLFARLTNTPLQRTHFFQPIAVESLGSMNTTAYSFLAELGQKISVVSGDDCESSFLFQQISVLMQPYNAIFARELYGGELPRSTAIRVLISLLIFPFPREHLSRVTK